MAKVASQTIEKRTAQAHIDFRLHRKNGSISMIDAPQEYDKQGTALAVIVGLKDGAIIRCVLTRDETLNLIGALLDGVR